MGEKETVSEWGVHLLRNLQILVAAFPEHFLPDHVAELKCDHFYGGLPKQLKVMVAYLKASANEKTYSDYLPSSGGRLRRRKQWNHLVARLQPVQASPR